jgi:Mg-chelatase subunit ChlD
MLAFTNWGTAMNPIFFRYTFLASLLVCRLSQPFPLFSAEAKVQIESPKAGATINQEQNLVFVSGKVTTTAARSANVDIMLLLDASGSTARYAGIDLAGMDQLPESGSGSNTPQIFIGGMSVGGPATRNLRNSILAAEVIAARRLLMQLNSETTRVGLVSFGERAKLIQPLTHEFDRVRLALDEVYKAGPYGGTNMVEGIRTGITELMGMGSSEKKTDAVKVEFLLTDGFPTMPIGGGKSATPQDTDLAINAARLAGRAGIKVHVFALGEEALSFPRAAVGIAKQSGGTYTPVSRPVDILSVVENISAVGVDYVQIVNQTSGQKASQLRVAADGFFSAAVPAIEGRNQIDVFARASDGSNGKDSVTINYQSGNQKSLELEVFLEREKKLKLEVERLGKSQAEIQQDIERGRQDGLGRSQRQLPVEQGTQVQ